MSKIEFKPHLVWLHNLKSFYPRTGCLTEEHPECNGKRGKWEINVTVDCWELDSMFQVGAFSVQSYNIWLKNNVRLHIHVHHIIVPPCFSRKKESRITPIIRTLRFSQRPERGILPECSGGEVPRTPLCSLGAERKPRTTEPWPAPANAVRARSQGFISPVRG